MTRSQTLLQIALLMFGVFCCATAAIVIRMSSIHHFTLSALRLLMAALVLTPLFIRERLKHGESYTRHDLLATVLPGVLLGIHFISWIAGVRMTTVVNGSLIVNLVPIAMPFFLFFLLRERLTAREWLATGIAISGMTLLIGCDFAISREFFAGDIVCFVSMLFFCLYLALGRKYRHIKSIWLYVVPMYYVAGSFCLLASVCWGLTMDPAALLQFYPAKEWMWVACLSIVPTVIGHSILNHSMKHLRGQVVSILTMGQFVFAGIMAYFFLSQVPHWSLYAAAALLVASGIIVTCANEPNE